MGDKELSKGYHCLCGKYHRFPGYVYAHWSDEIVHTCSKCDRKWLICEGEVEEVLGD